MGFGSQTFPVRVAVTSRVGRNVGLGPPDRTKSRTFMLRFNLYH